MLDHLLVQTLPMFHIAYETHVCCAADWYWKAAASALHAKCRLVPRIMYSLTRSLLGVQQRRKRSRPRCSSLHAPDHVSNERAAPDFGVASDGAVGGSPACPPSESRRRRQQRRLSWDPPFGIESPGNVAPLSPGDCRLAKSEGIASPAMSADGDGAAFETSIRQQQPSASGPMDARPVDSSEGWQSAERLLRARRPASPPGGMFSVPESPTDGAGHLFDGSLRSASWHGGHGQRQTPPPPSPQSRFSPPHTDCSSGGRRVSPAAFVARLAGATGEAGEDDAMQDLFPDSPRGSHSVGLASQRRLGQETARPAPLHQPKKLADLSQFAFKRALR